MQKILVASEDNENFVRKLSEVLPSGYKLARSQPSNIPLNSDVSCVFFDLDTIGAHHIREYANKIFVIAATSQEKTTPVMEAATWGAYEILQLPFKKERIAELLDQLYELKKELENPITIAKDTLAPAATCVIVGNSALVMSLCEKVARIAQVEVPVLITGETGTGKELVAEAIAQLSSRFGRPFVVINSAAVPDTLLESELFGHEKGAFTGAVAAKEGMLKTADGGCVFFDEVGELPLSLQGKLLRFLQTQTFYPVGSTREVHVNVRVISATNRNLTAMVREGKFREDLYHRLRVASIHVPPLRDRKKDIASLVQCLFYRHSHTAQKPIKGVTRAFLKKLLGYDWPGNIRELENTIRSAIALCKTDFLTTHEIRDLGAYAIPKQQPDLSGIIPESFITSLKEALDKKERNIYEKIHHDLDTLLFEYVLSYTRENQSAAARLLGINRLTLRKKLGLQR